MHTHVCLDGVKCRTGVVILATALNKPGGCLNKGKKLL